MAEAPLIRLSGVIKHYGSGETRVDALKGIDFEMRAGSAAAPAGKSTLLNLIGCIPAPSGGEAQRFAIARALADLPDERRHHRGRLGRRHLFQQVPPAAAAARRRASPPGMSLPCRP